MNRTTFGLRSFMYSVRDRVKTSRFWWKYRHMVQRDSWVKYLKDTDSDRRGWYSSFMNNLNLKSVFEYGCGGGPNLIRVKRDISESIVGGFDISKYQVDQLANYLGTRDLMFGDKIDKRNLESQMSRIGLKRFDLWVFDRVMCLITTSEIVRLIEEYRPLMKYVVIDDFCSNDERYLVQAKDRRYCAKDYTQLMEGLGFRLISEEPSEYEAGDEFFSDTAKRLCFVVNE